ncbi:hypothetical protein DAPPUDRAFT_106278 [Daphnia pulex]|uniref:Uncharacterized protein n=1 Tax=Daphnia pulex TaxID=6669 RepID=E9GT62_DAPPU|nr:hypothetical protein DAPPUDRAFT_106278 [Daphnia pulex]|eukprot:EFX77313.1 hypothetical protein DAPPUDRAFT_106278 [Daphnia pulex]
MSIKTQTIMGRLLMFDEIIKGKAEMVRQVEDVMLVVEPVDTFRHKEYNCPDKMQEERKEHRRNTENQTQDFHPNSNKKAYFLLSLHFVIWLDDLSISIMILELLKVKEVGKTEFDAVGIVDVSIISYVYGEELIGELDALFVPGLGANLYSIEMATELGINVNFHEDKADFLFQDNRIMDALRVDK